VQKKKKRIEVYFANLESVLVFNCFADFFPLISTI
jgi:hypothetical protein